MNGTRRKREGYVTDILADDGEGLIEKQTGPFFAYLSHKATHAPSNPRPAIATFTPTTECPSRSRCGIEKIGTKRSQTG